MQAEGDRMPSRNTDHPRQPVMRDVARLAGVSHQSVSRVINHHPQVSADVRARVQAAMKQLGYKPNTVARALASRRTMNIGVVAAGSFQFGPTVMLLSIAEAARRAGYATRLLSPEVIDRQSMQTALDQL